MALTPLLDRLDAWKANFGQGDAAQLEKLLTAAAGWRPGAPADAIRLHETSFSCAPIRGMRGWAERDPMLFWLHCAPPFELLRDDPRFEDLHGRMPSCAVAR